MNYTKFSASTSYLAVDSIKPSDAIDVFVEMKSEDYEQDRKRPLKKGILIKICFLSYDFEKNLSIPKKHV